MAVNGDTFALECTSEEGRCITGGIQGAGCEALQCDEYAKNDLGYCGCDGQFWMSDDCR